MLIRQPLMVLPVHSQRIDSCRHADWCTIILYYTTVHAARPPSCHITHGQLAHGTHHHSPQHGQKLSLMFLICCALSPAAGPEQQQQHKAPSWVCSAKSPQQLQTQSRHPTLQLVVMQRACPAMQPEQPAPPTTRTHSPQLQVSVCKRGGGVVLRRAGARAFNLCMLAVGVC